MIIYLCVGIIMESPPQRHISAHRTSSVNHETDPNYVGDGFGGFQSKVIPTEVETFHTFIVDERFVEPFGAVLFKIVILQRQRPKCGVFLKNERTREQLMGHIVYVVFTQNKKDLLCDIIH